MLKKINVHQLGLGMHLHAFEGAWIDHPFWRTSFVLTDAADLKKVLESDVRECWIDVGKGLDVAAPERPATQPAVVPAAPPAPPPPPLPARQREPGSMADELQLAAAICKRGREAVATMFNDVRLGHAMDADQCLPLVEEISNSVFRNPGALVSLARLKTHDDYSYMHSMAVCALMVSLARQLGQGDDDCREAGKAGLLHDIGKALMPTEILTKPGKLTDEEFAVMRSHPERGHALLLENRGSSAAVLEVCLHHHEKMDGSGYPHKLHGDGQISLLARMGAVCDVYDAITSNRPYKAGWDPAESIASMASWKGHFDERIFSSFVRSIGIYPTGSLVRMRSGNLAVVIEQNPGKPAAPVVRLFFSTKSNMPIPIQRLDLAGGRSSDRITGREPAERWGFKQLDDLWLDPMVRKGSK